MSDANRRLQHAFLLLLTVAALLPRTAQALELGFDISFGGTTLDLGDNQLQEAYDPGPDLLVVAPNGANPEPWTLAGGLFVPDPSEVFLLRFAYDPGPGMLSDAVYGDALPELGMTRTLDGHVDSETFLVEMTQLQSGVPVGSAVYRLSFSTRTTLADPLFPNACGSNGFSFDPNGFASPLSGDPDTFSGADMSLVSAGCPIQNEGSIGPDAGLIVTFTVHVDNTASFPPECGDSVDNDGDGFTDYPLDPGCDSAGDPLESARNLPCDDEFDNDGDGRIDFDPMTFDHPGDSTTLPEGDGDPGCKNPGLGREDPLCQNGRDDEDDDQGQLDYDAGLSANGFADPAGPDPQCAGTPWREWEKQVCGVGFELALLLPGIGWLRRRHTAIHGRAKRG